MIVEDDPENDSGGGGAEDAAGDALVPEAGMAKVAPHLGHRPCMPASSARTWSTA
ncbi:MAG: hypothetical protein KF688_00160 [Pirellulales bacterium]|nr:hypothetical protein [Pirellulales bacterium]